jgi:murein DD-endopeptidase MepM/ murein hydrolase activator NlpD
MKRLTLLSALVLLLLPTQLPWWLDLASPLRGEPLLAAGGRVVRGTVGRRDTLASALARFASPLCVARVAEAARPVYDLARLSVGRPFGLVLGPDGLVRAFSYGIDELRTVHVVRRGDAFRAELATRAYETRTEVVSGVVELTLFGAVEAAGETDQLALDLADVFAWDVDFNTEIQRGDSFRVVVERLWLDGRVTRSGRLLAAELVRGSRVLRAVRHEGAAGTGYYDAAGRPLRKAFLRSPLRFTRISSRFTGSRLHPILRVVRAHLGVDYAAPAGTPVHAASGGVVVAAGWAGGYGKTVRLRHANGYETLYGHLSRLAVRAGQRVAQGDPIGAVGSTGLATGPHLDYRMARNGQFVDPLRVQLPPAEPIAARERPAFLAESGRLLAQMAAGAPRPRVPPAPASVLYRP